MDNIALFGIGGTNFHVALGSEDGELLTEITTEPTRVDGVPTQVLEALHRLERTTNEGVDAVSIACKGLVDRAAGVITGMNMRDGSMRRDIDLRATITHVFDVPLYLENDCAASALAEYTFGAGDDVDSLVHITIGTGIGAGVVDRGHLVRGETNFAAEIGAIPVGPPDGREAFGIPGAWEAYCSGPGVLAYVIERLESESEATDLRSIANLSPQDIIDCAMDGDAVAKRYLETIAEYNARGCATVANLFDPGLITLGGGVALNNYEFVIDGIARHIDRYLITDRPAFAPTPLGEDIAIYGALAQYDYLTSERTAPVPAQRMVESDE